MEWVACGLPYGYSGDTCDTFTGQGLNVPGTLIETAAGRFLIGDINPLRGVCDDCTEFDADEIVLRYRVEVDKNGC